MDRPPPRRNRPPLGPSSRGGRRRGAHGQAQNNNASAGGPPPPRQPPSPSPQPSRTRSKNRRRRGGGGGGNGGGGGGGSNAPSVAVKLVVRRLPPTLTADAFAEAADPAGANKAVWRSFAPGSASAASGAVKRLRQVTRHAVAYLGFATLDDAVAFTDSFNGIKFADPDAPSGGQAQDFIARVERAPWQAVAPLNKRNRPLPLQGTIENDSDYINFVKGLEEEANREVSRAGALTVAQTSAMFPGKPGAAGAAAQAAGEKSETGAAGVLTSRGKSAAVAAKGSGLVTPLMEDVRARRKERDQKKKSTKASSRPPRSKGRQIVVVDPATRQHGEQPGKGSSSSSRRRKQRERRAAEIANSTKKQEETQPQKRVNGKAPVNGRRDGGGLGPRRDEVEPRMNGSIHANGRGVPQQNGGGGSDANGFAGNGKGNGSRGGSGRSRSGRSARSRAKNNAGSASAANGSADSSHGSVRLLKKETSNGHKT